MVIKMEYISIKEASVRWNISERSIRNYCINKRIEGAILEKGEWKIPSNSNKPTRLNAKTDKNYLLDQLRLEKKNRIKGGIYHCFQVLMTYNSNHIEGSKLSHDETRFIFETRTISLDVNEDRKTINVDDIIESINHFECIDKVIDSANYPLTERFIKELHRLLKFNTASARLPYFNIGEYKSRPNTIGGEETTPPMLVGKEINQLLKEYLKKDKHTLNEIIDFHVKFEKIHPFQDGNGRIGRLIILKECLKNNVVPFIIFDDVKLFYYRGLKKWNNDDRYLIDTCLHCQDRIKETLDYFKINYK